MKLRGWVAAAVMIAGGVVFANRGCLNQKAPDEKLADHIEAVCDIARAHVETPEAGVRLIGRYFGANGGEIMREFGDTLTTIEAISDDDAHDARAELAAARIRKPAHACEQDWIDFNNAIADDPAALEAVDHGMGRLARTLQILIDGEGRDFAHLPQQLEHLFDAHR